MLQESYSRLIRARTTGRIRHAKAFLFATARNAAILACRAKGLTQAETARLLNVSQPLVSKVLRAARN